MAYFNLPFSIRISNANPIDGDRYIVANDTERDALITNGRAFEGLPIWHTADSNMYYLHTLGVDAGSSVWKAIIGQDHGEQTGLGDDDHTHYMLVDGTRGFTGAVSGVYPSIGYHLSTKSYVDTINNALFSSFYSVILPTYYVARDGSSPFTAPVSGQSPIDAAHLTTKQYVDQGDSDLLSTIGTLESYVDDNFYNRTDFTDTYNAAMVGSPIITTIDGFIDGDFIKESELDHNSLGNLSVGDYHTQYLPVDGSRSFLGDLTISGGVIAEDESTLSGIVLTGDANFNDNLAYFTEYSNGNITGATTLNWASNGMKQAASMTGDVTFTFTDPPGACNLLLRLVQDITGSRAVTWPASVVWVGGVVPTLSTAGESIDIVTFYFNGINYYGVASLAFA